MSFSSINIQGNIISSEILDKIRSEEKYKFQQPESFGLARTASLRDEIGLAWSVMRTHWQAYKKRLGTLPKGDTGTSLTREKLILPLLTELGYEVAIQRAQQVGGKSYAISHGVSNRGNFPIHIMGYNDHLDKRRDNSGPRLSPHALVQEYLNNTEHLFALVTNGRQLRLLRDATRLVRMSYLEFDLEQMFEEELYSDFSMLYRVLHVSRMPEKIDLGAESVIEYYHQESLASGTRIREKLSEAVEESIKTLANGFLTHQKNESLVNLFEKEQLKPDIYYTYQLRLIYRILFLIVLEERKLVYPDNLTEDEQRHRNIYYKYYSIERLRKLTENRVYVDADKYDLWESLKTTFLLFEQESYGLKLGIKPLGSGLFAPEALGVLKELYLKNGDLVEVIKRLTTFIGEQGQLVRVNYSDLDVEEFGSVYEGLLEYDPKVEKLGSQWEFSFIEGESRSSSGSHYTPEELVKPLIKHSLDYIITDKLKEPNPEDALLSIKVCDVACGSGHILLSAARKIATELASLREGAEQPSPAFYRASLREVIRECIYGVDLNPLAVELTKVALWIEAHNPGEPLNFLDHHIKNGNAILGLAQLNELEIGIENEAFKTLKGDNKGITKKLRSQNTKERKNLKGQQKLQFDKEVGTHIKELSVNYTHLVKMPENSPDEVDKKTKAYEKLMSGAGWLRLKQLADLQTAQFFLPKTSDNEELFITDSVYRNWLLGSNQILGRGPAVASAMAVNKKYFHWFLEFPMVIQNGGFDVILGNPPFKGGQKISGDYGDAFAEYIKHKYAPIGSVDLVTYFFRRIYSILKKDGFQSLISTNTIAQGDARVGGLAEIIKQGGSINHAVRSMKWPGIAAVEVALVTIHKGDWKGKYVLEKKEVSQITSYLDDSIPLGDPYPLKANEGKSFQGSIVLGKGFVLEPDEAKQLIEKNPLNQEVLYPYLNGDDLNNRIDQSPSRWVINFKDWPLRKYTEDEWNALTKKQKDKIQDRVDDFRTVEIAPPNYEWEVASDYPDCLDILESEVKDIRQEDNREAYRIFWWQYAEKRIQLYKEIKDFDNVLVSCRVSKYINHSYEPNNYVYDVGNNVIFSKEKETFQYLQSSIHQEWAWKYASTLESRIRYLNKDCIDTFPLIQTNDFIGDKYNSFRKKLMENILLGLTKTYNAFHAKEIQISVNTNELLNKSNKEIEIQFGKEVWNLWNHLQKTEGTCSWEEAVQGIVELRQLHKQMDETVLEAYGWHEDTPKWGNAIDLRHDFYEVDYLPENDRVRFTIHPEARKEILKRLLLLNHERYEEEIMQGLHKKKDVLAFYEQIGKPVPEGVVFSDSKDVSTAPKPIKPKADKKDLGIIQKSLFPTENETTMREFGVHEGIYSIKDAADIIGKKYHTVLRWFKKLAEAHYEGLDSSGQKDIENRRINFHGLVELVVIGTLLDYNFNMKKILKARTDLGNRTKKIYPFATNNVRDNLNVADKSIIFEFPDGYIGLDGTGQYKLEFIKEFFADIEFDNSGMAKRLLPTKGHKKIVIDPRVGGGKPTFESHKGVQVDTIIRFYEGPESIPEIMEDYGLSKEEIEAALEYMS